MTSLAAFSKQYIFGPNGLSLLRAFIGVSLPFLLIQPERSFHWIAFSLFVVGALSDFFDGYLARTFSLESQFGKFIDPLSDKILILAPLITFSFLGLYSMWWVVLIFLREFVVTFCRMGWLMDKQSIGAEALGKVKMVFQLYVLSVIYFYFVLEDYSAIAGWTDAVHRVMIGSLFAMNILTLFSGATFLYRQRALFKTENFPRFVSAVGVGFIPFAPGTWGSVVGLAFIALVKWNYFLYWFTFFALLAVGYWAVSKLPASDGKDPSFVVMDEVLGMFITFMLVPLNWVTAIVGFLLFRLFDIIKPFPLRRLEKLPGYWGILCDDLGAGFYAWVVLFLFFW